MQISIFILLCTYRKTLYPYKNKINGYCKHYLSRNKLSILLLFSTIYERNLCKWYEYRLMRSTSETVLLFKVGMFLTLLYK